MKLEAMKRLVGSGGMEMEVIVNPKHLDRGVDVIQLETAAGAAVKNFKGACGKRIKGKKRTKKKLAYLLQVSTCPDRASCP